MGLLFQMVHGRRLAILSCLAVVCLCTSPAGAQNEAVPLEGPAYTAADEAYAAFNKGDFQRAATKARESVALRPDVSRLHFLLIDALVAAGDLAQAEQAATRAVQLFGSNPEAASRLANIRQRLAQGPASEGYSSLAAGNPKAAITAARRAVEYAPEVMSYRLLLLSAQLADNNLSDAFQTANDAIAQDRGDYVPLVWRAYINQRLGNRPAAVADFNAALALPGITETDQKNIRLIAADAALASNEPASAIALLRVYLSTDPKIIQRLNDAEAAASRKGTLRGDGKTMPAPVQDCRPTAYGAVCSLEAPTVQSILIPPPDKATLSFEAADRAYQAERQKDYTVAIAEARKAIEADPERMSNRVLLVNLLMSAGRASAAEAEATKAINRGNASADMYVQRGFARNQLKNYPGAIADWEMGLRRGLRAEQSRNVRLSIADAALNSKQPLKTLDALQGMPATYDVVIRRAYALQALDRKDEALAAFTLAGRLATSEVQSDGALRAQIGLLAQTDRKPEARAAFDQALAQNRLRTVSAADLGYLAAQVGNDRIAVASFERAKIQGTLPPAALLDAGYAAKRNFENRKAFAFLKDGIDARYQGRFQLDEQQFFDVRRQMADLARVWGLNTSVSYGKVGAAPNPFALIPSNSSSYTGQIGSELYYRPEPFGYRNGALFEVFVRGFQTLYDEAGGPTGMQTTQGMGGARWKPFSEYNLVLEVDKLFRIGEFARDDTLLRAAFSHSVGTDLRVIDQSWPTWLVFAEIDHFVEHPQLIMQAEGRFGRSYRLDAVSRNLVFFPHAVIAASYDDALAIRQAYSAGAGASLRYWFGETKYMAPPSYLELTLQYRFRIDGDKRAEGVFAQALVNY